MPNHRRAAFAVLGVLAIAFGTPACRQDEPSDGLDSDTVGDTGFAPDVVTPTDSLPQGLFLGSSWSGGETNAPPTGDVDLSYTGSSATLAIRWLSERAYFVTGGGQKVGVKVSEGVGALQVLHVMATTPLDSDAWHWLVITQDELVRVNSTGNTGEPWSTHFFTGSAPRVVRVQGSTTKNPDRVHVRFSEPVDVSGLDAAGLIVVDGVSVGICAVRGDDCLDTSQRYVVQEIDVRMSRPFGPEPMRLRLNGTVSGAARTAAEGAAMTGDPVANEALDIAIASWARCDDALDDSTVYCWHDERSVPVH
jgi:hypothetical protein